MMNKRLGGRMGLFGRKKDADAPEATATEPESVIDLESSVAVPVLPGVPLPPWAHRIPLTQQLLAAQEVQGTSRPPASPTNYGVPAAGSVPVPGDVTDLRDTREPEWLSGLAPLDDGAPAPDSAQPAEPTSWSADPITVEPTPGAEPQENTWVAGLGSVAEPGTHDPDALPPEDLLHEPTQEPPAKATPPTSGWIAGIAPVVGAPEVDDAEPDLPTQTDQPQTDQPQTDQLSWSAGLGHIDPAVSAPPAIPEQTQPEPTQWQTGPDPIRPEPTAPEPTPPEPTSWQTGSDPITPEPTHPEAPAPTQPEPQPTWGYLDESPSPYGAPASIEGDETSAPQPAAELRDEPVSDVPTWSTETPDLQAVGPDETQPYPSEPEDVPAEATTEADEPKPTPLADSTEDYQPHVPTHRYDVSSLIGDPGEVEETAELEPEPPVSEFTEAEPVMDTETETFEVSEPVDPEPTQPETTTWNFASPTVSDAPEADPQPTGLTWGDPEVDSSTDTSLAEEVAPGEDTLSDTHSEANEAVPDAQLQAEEADSDETDDEGPDDPDEPEGGGGFSWPTPPPEPGPTLQWAPGFEPTEAPDVTTEVDDSADSPGQEGPSEGEAPDQNPGMTLTLPAQSPPRRTQLRPLPITSPTVDVRERGDLVSVEPTAPRQGRPQQSDEVAPARRESQTLPVTAPEPPTAQPERSDIPPTSPTTTTATPEDAGGSKKWPWVLGATALTAGMTTAVLLAPTLTAEEPTPPPPNDVATPAAIEDYALQDGTSALTESLMEASVAGVYNDGNLSVDVAVQPSPAELGELWETATQAAGVSVAEHAKQSFPAGVREGALSCGAVSAVQSICVWSNDVISGLAIVEGTNRSAAAQVVTTLRPQLEPRSS